MEKQTFWKPYNLQNDKMVRPETANLKRKPNLDQIINKISYKKKDDKNSTSSSCVTENNRMVRDQSINDSAQNVVQKETNGDLCGTKTSNEISDNGTSYIHELNQKQQSLHSDSFASKEHLGPVDTSDLDDNEVQQTFEYEEFFESESLNGSDTDLPVEYEYIADLEDEDDLPNDSETVYEYEEPPLSPENCAADLSDMDESNDNKVVGQQLQVDPTIERSVKQVPKHTIENKNLSLDIEKTLVKVEVDTEDNMEKSSSLSKHLVEKSDTAFEMHKKKFDLKQICESKNSIQGSSREISLHTPEHVKENTNLIPETSAKDHSVTNTSSPILSRNQSEASERKGDYSAKNDSGSDCQKVVSDKKLKGKQRKNKRIVVAEIRSRLKNKNVKKEIQGNISSKTLNKNNSQKSDKDVSAKFSAVKRKGPKKITQTTETGSNVSNAQTGENKTVPKPIRDEMDSMETEIKPDKNTVIIKSELMEEVRAILGRNNPQREEITMKLDENNRRVACCDLCGRCFGRRPELRRHMRIHSGDKPFPCEHCEKAFAQKYHLKRHMKNVHGADISKLFQCGLCDAKFDDNFHMERHMRNHGSGLPFRCEICWKTFSTKRCMQEHIMTRHMGVKPFPCPHCDKAFGRKFHLQRHIRVHTGDKPFQCEYCKRFFLTRGNMKAHTRRVHLKEKPYTCGVCSKTFFTNKCLQSHFKTHTGERPHQCEICEKRFSQRQNLISHLRIHSGDRPYKCETCEKCYTRISHLKRHMRDHGLSQLYIDENYPHSSKEDEGE